MNQGFRQMTFILFVIVLAGIGLAGINIYSFFKLTFVEYIMICAMGAIVMKLTDLGEAIERHSNGDNRTAIGQIVMKLKDIEEAIQRYKR